MKKLITFFPAPTLCTMDCEFKNAQPAYEFTLMPPTERSPTLGTANNAIAQFASGERL